MKTGNYPLVSIIIPAYNGANYLREAIDSALEQTYRNIEVIVVNDGSTDNGETERIALSYGDRIRYFHKENGGVSSALNVGISNMRGEYFSWLSHDDKYSPEKIELQISLLEKFDYPQDMIALCGSRQIDKDSNFLSDWNTARRFPDNCRIEWNIALQSLFRRGSFNGCALLIPKTAFDQCGLFNEELRFCQDYLMWIELCLHKFSLVYNDQPCSYVRVHDKQLTQTGRELFHKDSAFICGQILGRIVKLDTVQHGLLFDYARNNAVYNNKEVVKTCISEGIKANRLSLDERVRLNVYMMYGEIRPYIRKVYYRLLKHVKTQ